MTLTHGPPPPPQVREGLYYNPYFPGGAIAMPRMLADGGVEYDDGTPSNSSQQAKVGRAGWCGWVGGVEGFLPAGQGGRGGGCGGVGGERVRHGADGMGMMVVVMGLVNGVS